MTFEILMALSTLAMAGLSVVHSFSTRPRGEAWMLLCVGLGFGYTFPPIDINVFHHYTFHGELTLMNIPFYLGFAWYGFYYVALSLAEHLLGREAGRLRIALLGALLFGLLEAQWDPTLLEVGAMEMFLPSFATWPYKFHCGVPMFHAFLGFTYIYGFLVLRGARRYVASILVILAVILVLSLGMMSMVPQMEPVFAYFQPLCSQPVLVVLDAVHFSTTFVLAGLLAAWLLRIAGRRLQPEAE
jgi:hypothetical protein